MAWKNVGKILSNPESSQVAMAIELGYGSLNRERGSSRSE